MNKSCYSNHKYYNAASFTCPIQYNSLLPSNCKDIGDLSKAMSKLIVSSNTKSTWDRHKTAWSNYAAFCNSQHLIIWPANIEKLRAFTTNELKYKGLKPDTVKNYLGSIDRYHELNNWPELEPSKDPIIKLLLKGGENMISRSGPPPPVKDCYVSPPLGTARAQTA